MSGFPGDAAVGLSSLFREPGEAFVLLGRRSRRGGRALPREVLAVKLCVSLTEDTTAALVARMAELAELADLFEVRGRPRPRPRPRGGAAGAREASPVHLHAGVRGRPLPGPRPRAAPAPAVRGRRGSGFDFVDVNARDAFPDVVASKAGRGLVLSWHDLEGTPDDLDSVYDRMAALGPDVVKIAVTARSISDLGRLLAFAARHAADARASARSRSRWARSAWPRASSAGASARRSRSRRPPPGWKRPRARSRPARSSTATGCARSARTRASSASSARTSCAACLRRSRTAPSPSAAWTRSTSRCRPSRCPRLVDAIPALGVSGFSVTRPYKREIVRYLDSVTPHAAEAGSANTVLVQDGRLVGLSTDGDGVLLPLRRRIDPSGRAVTILGAGGAARAAAFALVRAGARVTVVARRAEQAREVAAATGCAAAGLEAGAAPAATTCSSTPRRSAPARVPGESPVAPEPAAAGQRRLRHGLRAARDAAPRRRAGQGLRHDRRRRDAGGAGGRAVRGLDGRHGAGRGDGRSGDRRDRAGRVSRRPRERPRDRPAHAAAARRPVLRRRGGPGAAPHRGGRGLGLRGLGLRGDHPAALRLRRRLRRRGARLEDLLVRGARREPARAAARLHEPAREDRGRPAARARGAAAALLLGRGRALRAGAGRPPERALPDGPRAPGRRRAGRGRRGGGDRGRVPRAAGRAGLRAGARPRRRLLRARRGGRARARARRGAARARRVEGPGRRAPGAAGRAVLVGARGGARAAHDARRRARGARPRRPRSARVLRKGRCGARGAARGGGRARCRRPRPPPGRGPRRGARARLLHRARVPRVRARPRLRGGQRRALRHARSQRFGRPLPAVGFMLGLDRVALLLERQGRLAAGRRGRAPRPSRRATLGAGLADAVARRARGARIRFGNGGAR